MRKWKCTLVAVFFASTFVLTWWGGIDAAPINLLTNPGFETGDFTGWTVTGTSSSTGVATAGTPIPPTFFPSVVDVRSGSFAAFASVAQGATGFPFEQVLLSQTLAVLPSTAYSLGYFASAQATGSSGFGFGNLPSTSTVDIVVDGVSTGPIFPIVIFVSDGFIPVSSTYTTGPSQTALTVTYSTSASGASVGISLDDYFFTGESPQAPIPEPSTMLLLASGLAGLGFFRWRRTITGEKHGRDEHVR